MPTAADVVLPVLCLAGPTACGKTDLAIQLAERFSCEIINTDSRQVYADFPLICAQPTEEERRKCPHHLYGMLATEEKISAGEWRSQACAVIAEVLARGHLPLLVGGTGMYFHALLHGIAPIPAVDPGIRAAFEDRLNTEGPLPLHAELMRLDPDYAAKIHPHDRQRIVRALEVREATGQTMTWWHRRTEDATPRVSGPLFVLAPARTWLVPRIGRRISWMVAQGALHEAERAFARCPHEQAPGWSGIGCAELLAFLLGRSSWEDCLALWQKNTQAYAKRQSTWFRGRAEAVFFSPLDRDAILNAAEQAVASFAL